MEIAYDKHNIDAVFSNTHYHIDFYQREYKWERDPVIRLIDDIFYRFENIYSGNMELTPNQEIVTKKYSWYYLNTYITNKVDGKTYVVDGQQRLTTLSLILISLFHLCDKRGLTQQKDWIRSKLAGIGPGGKKQYWLGHERRLRIMHALFENQDPTEEILEDDVTARNMSENYKIISSELNTRLDTPHKLDTFIYYYLLRVVLINLEVEQENVPMVFEVINDRGVRLSPYEILKGKLLGEIDKEEVHDYADIWEKQLHQLEATGLVDTFFRTYLRAKFSRSRSEGRDFDGAYHRVIDENKYDDLLKLKHNPNGVKRFIKDDFTYYSNLFGKISTLASDFTSGEPYYNSALNRMDGQAMLIMAACCLDDKNEDGKIRIIAKAFDKAYVMLQLNRAYESNQFQELLFTILGKIENKPIDELEHIIDTAVLDEINDRRKGNATSILTYGQFKQVGYGDYNTRFLRYFLARIELFISQSTELQMQDLLYNFVCGTGKYNSYHIEHILSRNRENKALFTDDNNEFDEALFEQERNRFGGLLLMKGRDNQSSGNEKYRDKLKTYTGSTPYLAQTLVEDFYKSNICMSDFINESELNFIPIQDFNREALELRSLLLFNIVKKIWNV